MIAEGKYIPFTVIYIVLGTETWFVDVEGQHLLLKCIFHCVYNLGSLG